MSRLASSIALPQTSLALAGLLMLAAFAPATSAQALLDTDIQVIRIETRDAELIQRLAVEYGHLIVDRAKGTVIVDTNAKDRQTLAERHLTWSIDDEATRALRLAMRRSGTQPDSIPGFSCYRTVAETKARLAELVAQNPGLASLIDIGDSWEKSTAQPGGGEDLLVLKLGNTAIAGNKPKVFIMGSIHAREFAPAELVLRFGEWLLANYAGDAEARWLLDHQEFHLLVHANPDGRKRAEPSVLWRKNTNTAYCGTTSDSRGADLNRNWPFKWAQVPNDGGSSSNPCMNTYRGPSAGSEPETQATLDYVRALFGDRRGPADTDPADADAPGLFFDLHSYSQLVLWPWGWTSSQAPNAVPLEALGRRFAKLNNYTPQSIVELYPTDGTTADTVYGELGVASYSFELGTAFFQDCQLFESSILPQNLDALRLAARSARAPYLVAEGPMVSALSATPDLATTGEIVTLRAQADDTRFSNANAGSQTAQAIASAQAWLGTPPWLAGATAQPMIASDGSYNSNVENLEVAVPTTGLDPGRHVAWVQARDAAGHDGPWSAAFVNVMDPSSIGTVTGSVFDLSSGAPIANARIEASEFSTTSNLTGAFERRLPVGTHTLLVSAADYESQALPDLVIQGGQGELRSIGLFPLCDQLLADAESAPTNWTLQAPWAITASASPQTGTKAFTESPNGNYSDQANTSLTSPIVNLSGAPQVKLSFDSWCDTEAGWDFGNVELSSNGGSSWSAPVWRCSGDPALRRVTLDLPALSNVSQARIRFRFTSDTNTVDDGWYIDNIRLTAGGELCRLSLQGVFANSFE